MGYPLENLLTYLTIATLSSSSPNRILLSEPTTRFVGRPWTVGDAVTNLEGGRKSRLMEKKPLTSNVRL